MSTTQGFFNLSDGITKGKGLDAVVNSRSAYSRLIAYFGGKQHLPTSIMRAKRAKPEAETDEPGARRSYSATSILVKTGKKEKTPKKLRAAFQISGSGAPRGALSTFWQDVGRTCVLLYTKPGDVVVDPFAGHNSRMDLCVRAGRHYIGHDLSADFMQFNRKRAEQLRKDYPEVRIELHEGDSRKLAAKTGVGDFTITSPPYWDIEQYGPEKEQMSNCPTYEEFIQDMGQVMRENFRVLKPGAIAAWFVNDFRKPSNVFRSYHYDTMTIAREAGFEFYDMLIVDMGRGFGDVFINEFVKNRVIPKRHEYGLIFRKPLPATPKAKNPERE